MNLNEKKILFADLDGTLITTVSGKTFAEDCTDFRIRKPVLDKIRSMSAGLERIVVVTNQGGIPAYLSLSDFLTKLSCVTEFVRQYCGVPCVYQYCASMNREHPLRKPNTGMLSRAERRWFRDCYLKSEMLMIGDASGKPGQFSDSDKKCAENYDIDYLDVDDFLKS